MAEDAPSPEYGASVRIRQRGLELVVRALTVSDGFLYAGRPRVSLVGEDLRLYVEIPTNAGVFGEERKFVGIDVFVDLPDDLRKEVRDALAKKEPAPDPAAVDAVVSPVVLPDGAALSGSL